MNDGTIIGRLKDHICLVDPSCRLCLAVNEIERLQEAREELWSCPECGFSYDRIHAHEDGSFSCPECENVRLREALEEIAVDDPRGPGEFDCIQIARAALEEK